MPRATVEDVLEGERIRAASREINTAPPLAGGRLILGDNLEPVRLHRELDRRATHRGIGLARDCDHGVTQRLGVPPGANSSATAGRFSGSAVFALVIHDSPTCSAAWRYAVDGASRACRAFLKLPCARTQSRQNGESRSPQSRHFWRCATTVFGLDHVYGGELGLDHVYGGE